LNKKDYYEILALSREATEDEIKRAYKKMAIKFHPDKNQSTYAADAFKKISHAFTTLKDPEKKQFYDKYGSEEELREKYSQQQQAYYHEEEEMDPFDLFEMFFSGNTAGFYQRNGRVFRRRRTEEDVHQHRQQQRQQAQNRQPHPLMWMQMLPLLVLVLYSILPYLFQSVIKIKF
jgi:DnaJ-class molecular chaperone